MLLVMQICKFYMQPLINEADNISHSRPAAVTINILTKYKEMITNTISDLEKHLHKIDNKLQTLSLHDHVLTYCFQEGRD
jgi:hypothetical protein